jgi:hypothetical protein
MRLPEKFPHTRREQYLIALPDELRLDDETLTSIRVLQRADASTTLGSGGTSSQPCSPIRPRRMSCWHWRRCSRPPTPTVAGFVAR